MSLDWQAALKKFKESLAKRLWALPTVTETEKELVFKEYLSDLDNFERAMNGFVEGVASQQKAAKDENEILRSLLGVSEDDLKIQLLNLAQDKRSIESENAALKEEA